MRIRESSSHGIVEGSGIGGVEVNCSETDVSVAVQGDVVPGVVIEPQVGMEFESEASAKAFYDEYAKRVGFSPKLRVRPDGSAVSREFVCSKEGSKKKTDLCEAMLVIEIKEGNKWVVTKFVKEHNHALECHYKGQNSQPRGQSPVMVATGAMYVNMDGNHGNRASTGTNHGVRIVSSNCLNYVPLRPCPQTPQRRTFGKDGQNMLDYFKKMQAENPGFFYAIQLVDDNRMANAFWSDARSRSAYAHFGDAVILDTSRRVNQFVVPFAPFTGVNHHGEPILFGCALLLDDSEASYVWLLRTFLTLGDRPPVSIVTDKNRAIQVAVSQVLPNARHCISKFHVLKEGQDKLDRVCLAYPNFQVDLYNCINLTYTIEEFESSWASIIDKYDLSKNDWLQSIYNARREWVPVYFRDSFFAAVFPNHEVDCSFFEGHVNQHTTLPFFFRQYERAMEYWFEKETEADFDTISKTPVLKTPSPMEKQASDLYTRKIFTKFQEELVETFAHTANRIDGDDVTSTYQVANYDDDSKSYTVTFNISDLRAVCSCLMFEYSGILCRHILTVFTVTNVLTLPTHYILNRWTRNAKSVIASGELSADHIHESRASRYNNLCREANRYALEGATTSESYYAALTALQEGGRNIDLAKKSFGNAATQIPEAGTIGYDDNKSSGADTPSLWPQQDEGALRFNLNDSAIPSHPVSDMSLIRMAPTTLQRDNGPSDNMAVLPCLKSMTWVMENQNSAPANRIAIINLKLQDYSRSPAVESEVKFQLSRVTLEPMLKSMAYICEQLSTPANRVAVINLKLRDTETITGESEVKFQVSRDTLGAMLRSMAYIREQLPFPVEQQAEPLSKKQRK